MEKRAEELLERIAVGVEKLGEEPEMEIPSLPPLCPACGIHNPMVNAKESGGTGHMSEIYLELQCTQCDTTFYVIPQGWVNVESKEELKEFFERAADGNGREAN